MCPFRFVIFKELFKETEGFDVHVYLLNEYSEAVVWRAGVHIDKYKTIK